MKKFFTIEERQRISKIYSSMVSLENNIELAKEISQMGFGEFEESCRADIEEEDNIMRFILIMPYLRLLHIAVFVYDLDIELMKEYNNYEKKLTLMGATMEEARQIYETEGPF